MTNPRPTSPTIISLFEQLRRPPLWVRSSFYAISVLAFIAIQHEASLAVLFPLVFAIPVLIASWWDGRPMGYSLAALSMARWPTGHSWMHFTTRALALILLIELVCGASDLVKRVRILKGLLPICMHCHRIRIASEQWMRLEEYINKHSEASFTHGICPSCMASH